jgi:hypothetical protein
VGGGPWKKEGLRVKKSGVEVGGERQWVRVMWGVSMV